MTSRLRQLASQITKMATKTDITLYTTNTPNGIKASILLEELNLSYKVCSQSLSLARFPKFQNLCWYYIIGRSYRHRQEHPERALVH